jgi:hypothetical protein
MDKMKIRTLVCTMYIRDLFTVQIVVEPSKKMRNLEDNPKLWSSYKFPVKELCGTNLPLCHQITANPNFKTFIFVFVLCDCVTYF